MSDNSWWQIYPAVLTFSLQQSYDLFWSAIMLTTFWLVGAAIFNSLEKWGYGWVMMLLQH